MNVTTTDATPVAAPIRLMADSVISESLAAPVLAWETQGKRSVAKSGRYSNHLETESKNYWAAGSFLRMAFHRRRHVCGRFVPADRTDRLHDRQPVPVDPRVDDPAFRHLVPGAGGGLPLLAARGITSENPEVGARRAHAHGDQVALGDLVLEGHLDVRKGGHEAANCGFEAFARGQVIEALKILAHESRVEVLVDDISRFLFRHASEPRLSSFPKPSRPPLAPTQQAVSLRSQARHRGRGLPTWWPRPHDPCERAGVTHEPAHRPDCVGCRSVPTALPRPRARPAHVPKGLTGQAARLPPSGSQRSNKHHPVP